LDTICLRHLKELEELQRYNLNEERKYLNNGKEQNSKELKQHVSELQSEYKRRKDELKRDIASKVSTSREKEECIKVGKERLHADIKQKEDAKRKQLEIRLTEEMCMLKRKHMVMFHKREYDLLLNASARFILNQVNRYGVKKRNLDFSFVGNKRAENSVDAQSPISGSTSQRHLFTQTASFGHFAQVKMHF